MRRRYIEPSLDISVQFFFDGGTSGVLVCRDERLGMVTTDGNVSCLVGHRPFCYAFIVTYDAFVSVNEYRIPYSSELLNRERYGERRSTGSQRLSENGKQMQRHRLVSVISKSLRRTGRRSCTLTSTNISPFSFCSIKGQLGAIEIIRKTFNSYY